MNKVMIFIVLLFGIQMNAQNVGIGTTTPAEKLDVSGNIRTTGEIKPNGVAGQANQVLTSNGNGTMSWASMSQNNEEETTGNGTWGDCNTNNLTGYQPVADEDGQALDQYGHSVSISGNYAVIGAPLDDELGLTNCGSATIMKHNSSNGLWEFHSKLTNQNANNTDYFGASVAMSGDLLVVGTYFDDISGLTDIGSASIYKRNTNTNVWEFQTKLVNPNPEAGDWFGFSVAISGDYVIVGAPNDDESGFLNTGSATIYKLNPITNGWQFQGKLTNNLAAIGDQFGWSVGITEDYAIIGAKRDSEGGFTNNGSASIYQRNTSTGEWEFQTKLTHNAPANTDEFGNSVAISGNYAVVGTRLDDHNGLTNSGSASVFRRNATSGVWEFRTLLINKNPESDDEFGSSVSISGDYVMVGSETDDENGLLSNGSVSVFKIFGNTLLAIQKFSNPNALGSERFGKSVSIDAGTRRFLTGASGANGSMGMAFFGKIK